MNNLEKIFDKLEDEEKLIFYAIGALNQPIKTKIKLQKLLFLFSNVFKDYKDLLEFDKHLFGPHSETIEYIVEDLEQLGLIKTIGSHFILSDKGQDLFKHLKPKKELLNVLEDFKLFLNDLTDDEVLTFVYVSYPNYIEELIKWEELQPKRLNIAISLLRKNKISYYKAVEVSGLNNQDFEKILIEKKVKWK